MNLCDFQSFPVANAKKDFLATASIDATKRALKLVTTEDAQTFLTLNVFVTLDGLELIAQ